MLKDKFLISFLLPFIKDYKVLPSLSFDILPTKNLMQACNFTKSNTHPWVFFTFFKLYKWYQIAQRITYMYYTYIFESATLLKVTLLHGCFSRFLNCTNGTKLHNASHMKMSKCVTCIQNIIFHAIYKC